MSNIRSYEIRRKSEKSIKFAKITEAITHKEYKIIKNNRR